jgi:hypothetical protein
MPHRHTPEKKVVLKVQATVELDPGDFAHIDGMDVEDLKHRMYEAIETTLPVKFKRGVKTVRGTIRFLSPTPYELKLARMAARGEA